MGIIFLKEETLGQRIRAQRIRLGMTQDELAEAMTIPKSTISAYENDKVDIKSSVILELSRELQTDPNYLLGAAGEENRFVNEAAELLRRIEDKQVQKILLTQIRALVEAYM